MPSASLIEPYTFSVSNMSTPPISTSISHSVPVATFPNSLVQSFVIPIFNVFIPSTSTFVSYDHISTTSYVAI